MNVHILILINKTVASMTICMLLLVGTTGPQSLVFYSILTFFVGPLLTRPFMSDHPDQCIAGFLLGFTISIFLWMKFGRKLAKK